MFKNISKTPDSIKKLMSKIMFSLSDPIILNDQLPINNIELYNIKKMQSRAYETFQKFLDGEKLYSNLIDYLEDIASK